MKILLTGASSFTGYWFARELAAAGHELVMTFRRELEAYDGIRRTRVEGLRGLGRAVYGCAFGDRSFIDLIRHEAGWDLLCHHGADVTDYKSPDFNVAAAVANNTRELNTVLAALVERNCGRVLVTGSVFEPGEGAGSNGLPAFSPYGLSKALTAQCFDHYAQVHGLRLGKFVIPNPFGPFEEPRFTQYLVRNWYEAKVPTVSTPAYVRDNIHVSLLAKAYAAFAVQLPATPGTQRYNPSGYIETQGAFALRFAEQMQPRLGLPCPVELKHQTKFAEPRIRINTDALDTKQLGWDESAAWNELGRYYHNQMSAVKAAGA